MPERRQHVGEIGRPAAGQQIDAVEVAERPDHREQRAGQVQRLHRRPGDEAEFLPPAGAVDVGRLEQVLRDRKPSGHQDQGPERQRFPDVHADRHGQRHGRIVEPVRAVLAGELEDQLVDHAPFGIEHEAHRQDGRDRRHRPGQDEQHRQPFDPGARCAKKPDRNSAITILKLMPINRKISVLTAARAKIGSL